MLSAVRLPADLGRATARGQYAAGWQGGEEVVGYLEEEGDRPRRRPPRPTPRCTLDVDTRRWAGVPFYLRTGKRLGKRVTEIAVVFKRAPHLPFEHTATEELGQNAIVIRVQPDEGVTMRFGSKVPGRRRWRSATSRWTSATARVHRGLARGVRAAHPRRAARRPAALPAARGGRARPGRSSTRSSGSGPSRAQPEQYAAGTWGPPVGRRDARPRRTDVEACRDRRPARHHDQRRSRKTLVALRDEGGAMALGRVLTLVIVVERRRRRRGHRGGERRRAASTPAASSSSSRGNRRGTEPARRRRSASAATPARARSSCCGSTARSPTTAEPSSLPLLLPDSPIVAWWPGDGPGRPSARTRSARWPSAGSPTRPQHRNPRPWLAAARRTTRRATPTSPGPASRRWRGLLAAALDQPPYEPVTGAVVSGATDSPVERPAGRLARASAPRARCTGPRRPRPGRHQLGAPRAQSGPIDLVRPGRRRRDAVAARPAGPRGSRCPHRELRRVPRRRAASPRPRRGLRGRAAARPRGAPAGASHGGRSGQGRQGAGPRRVASSRRPPRP